MDEWIPLTCPFCRVRLKIRGKYAHLRGRCPDCGIRIEAPRPRPADPATYISTSTAEDPTGLLPLDDDEWPEPAIHEQHDQDASGHYKIADGPIPVTPPKPDVPASKDVMRLAPEAPPMPSPSPAPQPPTPTVEEDNEVFTLLPEPVTPAAPAADAHAKRPREPVKAPEPPPLPLPLPPPASNHADVLDPIDIFQERAAPSAPAQPKPPEPVHDEEQVLTPYRIDPPTDAMPSPPPVAKAAPVAKPPPVAKLAPAAPPPESEEEDGDLEDEPPEDPPVDRNSTYQLNRAELKPLRAAPPPKRPFLEGLFGFPFRVSSLKPLIYLSIWFMVLGFQCGLIRLVLESGSMLAVVAAFVIGFGVMWVVILSGSYAASIFLSVLQETAAGNDDVSYSDFDWKVSFFQFLRIGWVGAVSVLPFAFLGSLCMGLWPALIVGSIIGAATFPICLLCSLAADSWIKLVDGQMLARFGKKPHAMAVIYFYSVVLALACAGIWWVTTMEFMMLAPVMGFLWSTSVLFYGRLLGRAGYVLTYEGKKKKRKKRRKPAAGELPQEEELAGETGT